jgi:hypothetical protein
MNAQQATGRDINQQAVEARLAEQTNARQQLGGLIQQQQASADQAVNQYLQLGYDFATATKMAQQQMALAQAGMQQQTNMAKASQQSAIIGGLIGGASSAGAAAMGKPPGAAHGGRVPGVSKDNKDDLANDTKPYMLSAGEVVLPKSVASNPDKAKSFVQKLLEQEKAVPGASSTDFQQILALRSKMKGG